MAPILVALSLVTAIIGVVLAVMQLRDVARRPSPAGRSLPSKLRKLPADERVAKAVEIAEPGSWEAELAAQLVAAPSPMERADSASEAVGDLAGLYASRSRWAPAALRIQVAVGLLSAALLFARGSRLEAAVAMAIAVIGGLVSHLVGEAAAEREKAQRSLADEIVLLLVPDLVEGRRPRQRAW